MGKVYMVVGGAPEENETHPKDIALGMDSCLLLFWIF